MEDLKREILELLKARTGLNFNDIHAGLKGRSKLAVDAAVKALTAEGKIEIVTSGVFYPFRYQIKE